MSGESVYDIIKPEVYVPEKGPMYQSAQEKKKVPPTCSSFGIHGTSVVLGNCGGSVSEKNVVSVHPAKKKWASMGKSVVDTVDPSVFLKMSGNRGVLPDHEVDKFNRTCSKIEETHEGLRAPVPLRDDNPPTGLQSDTNFVLSNAVEAAALGTKREPAATDARAVDRRTFGKVPAYVTKRAAELADGKQVELDRIVRMREEQRMFTKLTVQEGNELRQALHNRWDILSKKQAKMGFTVETRSQREYKEQVELQMRTIEEALRRISRDNIWIFDENKLE